MSDKPRIDGFCAAGCRWETVHKEDFIKSASIVKTHTNILPAVCKLKIYSDNYTETDGVKYHGAGVLLVEERTIESSGEEVQLTIGEQYGATGLGVYLKISVVSGTVNNGDILAVKTDGYQETCLVEGRSIDEDEGYLCVRVEKGGYIYSKIGETLTFIKTDKLTFSHKVDISKPVYDDYKPFFTFESLSVEQTDSGFFTFVYEVNGERKTETVAVEGVAVENIRIAVTGAKEIYYYNPDAEIVGRGEQGIQGEAGKSAYQTWRDKGNTGSEEDFLNSLKGEGIQDGIGQITYKKSQNLYDASLQTDETISPHYYVNGAPYSTTQFDNAYNCTAFIEVEPNTQYSVGLVETTSKTSIPWNEASHGAFFYDDNGNYISGSKTNTFTTPVNTKYMRFNYAISLGITLAMLNSCCMLVKGDTLPTKYEPYGSQTFEEKVADIEELANPALYYKITGEEICVVTKYGATKDFAITLKRKGGNNLFDFYKFGTIANDTSKVSARVDSQLVLAKFTTDWIAPFKIVAKNNGDGDQPNNYYFTGGNHQYNNSGSGSTATARCGGVRFFADGREVSDTEGYANNLEIRTTNYIQASNTTKADGSGREVLQQNVRFLFDGVKWTVDIELIPLEDLSLMFWYGIQCVTQSDGVVIYPNIKYIGATNRGVYDTSGYGDCGDLTTNEMILYSDEHELSVSIDTLVDMGKEEYASGSEKMRCFTSNNKAYFTIYANSSITKTLTKDCHYYLRGAYRFTAR